MTVVPPIEAFVLLTMVSMVIATFAVPDYRRTPMTSRPLPMIVGPSPATPYPDVTLHRARWGGLYDWSRHGRQFDNRCRSDVNRS